MITNSILILISGFISLMVSILPTNNGFDSTFLSAISNIISYAEGWNSIIPVDTILAVLSFMLIFEVSILGWRVTHWIIRTFRGG